MTGGSEAQCSGVDEDGESNMHAEGGTDSYIAEKEKRLGLG